MPRRFNIVDDRGEQSFTAIEVMNYGDAVFVKCSDHPIRKLEDYSDRKYTLEDRETGEQFEGCWISVWDPMNDEFRFEYPIRRNIF